MKYKIIFKEGVDKVEKELLRKIKSKHNNDIEGINDLYDQLILHGTCDSKIASRIYYVAYTLALENIELILIRVN
ncbi:MAG TPA: hypothetical protein VFC70_02705 [Oscillospiraceae bacterium]|nr:hypothetical protein [Oscillospiraceae bacterium]